MILTFVLKTLMSCFRTLRRALFGPNNNWSWIGLSDQGREGDWRWVNGRQARTDDASLWQLNQPDGGESQNCGRSQFNYIHANGFFVVDSRCSTETRSICEKLV